MGSLWIIALGAVPEIRMPHNKKKLTHCEINIFRRWVNQGANDN